MRLSEMSTEQLAQTMCRLAPPVCRILQDPAVAKAMEAFLQAEEDHRPVAAAAGSMLQLLTPALMQDHLDDVCEALAALTGQEAAALRRQNGLATLRALTAVWDEELADFFGFAGGAARRRS